jgi:pimeloyl-ACP methyl ester carboxylesterase
VSADGSTLGRVIPESVSEQKVTVADLSVRVVHKGSGPPLVFVHDSLGNLGWTPFYEKLAESFAVYVPDLPGYGLSERPEWARSPRDEAILLLAILDKLGLDNVVLIGVGFGGYIAAEAATMNQGRLSRLVLVGAVGIKPREGEIADQVLMGFAQYGISGFRDPQSFAALFGAEELPPDVYELWDFSNEMTARVCWKPWMYSDQLPELIKDVRVPTLLVWGRHDHLVPLDIAHQYQSLLPNARLEVVADAGHFVDLEQPDELARLVSAHASS